jgi:asparagine synthase (glutamine-hydrolysing)
MSGIAGVYDTRHQRERSLLLQQAVAMQKALILRGNDGSGVWSDPDYPFVMTHQRSAVLDVSASGNQPYVSHTGRYVMVYDGEIYNYLNLRTRLVKEGAEIKGINDTATMMAAFEAWGFERTLRMLEGMFSFVLWDRQEKIFYAARDPMGKKPLYIGWAGKDLVFASELKSIRAYDEFVPVVDKDALALYLRFNYVPAPYCIYQNIWQLPPGHYLSMPMIDVAAGTDLTKYIDQYYSLQDVVESARSLPAPSSLENAIDELEALLKHAVEKRMITDVPLGAFLSGGIDSSLVVAMMRQVSAHPIQTFSIGFDDRDFDESDFSREIALQLGTDHHELMMTSRDVRDVLPVMPRLFDEPFGDRGQISLYLAARLAKKHVKVVLSGGGGDELFGGYRRYVSAPEVWRRMRFLPRPMRNIMARQITRVPMANWDDIWPPVPTLQDMMAQEAVKYESAGLLQMRNLNEVYDSMTAHFMDPSLLMKTSITQPKYDVRLNEGLESLTGMERFMLKDTLTYLPYDVLVKLDRSTMGVGLEARTPLLDLNILKYAWSLPLSMKIHGQNRKYILQELLARHIPRPLFERPKQGFGMPLGRWLRKDLRDWAEHLLDAKKLEEQNLFNVPVVRDIWADHCEKRANNANRIWCLLMFQSWYDEWLD